MKEIIKICLFGIVILMTGCGDAPAKTKGVPASSQYDMRTVMYVGESREVELNLKEANSYTITTASKQRRVYHDIDYSNRVRPMLNLKGLHKGQEEVIVKANMIDQKSQSIKVSVLVLPNQDSDRIDGEGSDGNTTDPNPPDDNGTTGPPSYDPYACVYTNDFTVVEDDWSTTEGRYGKDYGGRIQSKIITNIDTTVTLFYPKVLYAKTPPAQIVLGTYKYTTIDNKEIIYAVDLAQDLLGKFKYFYVKSNGYCMRMNIPSNPLTPPDKSIQLVNNFQ